MSKNTRVFFFKNRGGLWPADEIAEEAFAKIGHGEVVSVEIKKSPNNKLHRKYWALVNLIFRNQDKYVTRDQVHKALKRQAGIYDIIELLDGTKVIVEGSISIDSMSEIQFAQFYERVCDIVATHFLPGVSVAELRAEVESLIGIAPRT